MNKISFTSKKEGIYSIILRHKIVDGKYEKYLLSNTISLLWQLLSYAKWL